MQKPRGGKPSLAFEQPSRNLKEEGLKGRASFFFHTVFTAQPSHTNVMMNTIAQVNINTHTESGQTVCNCVFNYFCSSTTPTSPTCNATTECRNPNEEKTREQRAEINRLKSRVPVNIGGGP